MYSTYFDGTGDYLTGPTSNANLLLGTGNFTIEYWVYKTTATAVATVVSYGGSVGNLRHFMDNVTPTVWDGATQIGGGIAINLNSWNHIVLQRSGTTLRFYTNGISSATITNSSNFNAGTLGIGGGDANVMTGYIANLRIVKGTAVYTSNFVPPQSPVTAITNTQLLPNGTNAGVLDNAMMGDYETVGTTRIVTTIKKFGTSSIIFNGTTDYFVTKSNQAYAFNTGNFTVEMWLYPTSFVSYKSLYGNSTSAANATGFHTGLNASGNVFIYSASAFRLTTSNAMTLNAWNYVAIVRSGSTITVYINGTSGGTWTLTTQTFTDGQCFFGVAPGFSSEFYTGYLDDFRITKGFARTVTSLPTAAFPNS